MNDRNGEPRQSEFPHGRLLDLYRALRGATGTLTRLETATPAALRPSATMIESVGRRGVVHSAWRRNLTGHERMTAYGNVGRIEACLEVVADQVRTVSLVTHPNLSLVVQAVLVRGCARFDVCIDNVWIERRGMASHILARRVARLSKELQEVAGTTRWARSAYFAAFAVEMRGQAHSVYAETEPQACAKLASLRARPDPC